MTQLRAWGNSMFCLYRLRVGLCALALATSAGASANEPAPASETPAPIERPALSSRSASMAADLARQLPPAEVLSLQAGDEAFMALWQPANVAEPKGLVILLPSTGESADWPRGIGPLRRSLPDHGWHTLSLSLPDSAHYIAPAEPEPQPEPEEPASEDSEPPAEPEEAGYLPEETAALPGELSGEQDDETFETAEPAKAAAGLPERIDERIAAALDHARGLQAKTIILLGQGTGAYWAVRYLQQWAPDDVERLALIHPRQPDSQQEALAQLAPSLGLPTGDFYYRESDGARKQARERLNVSRRMDHPAYHQIGLTELTGEHKVRDEQLIRRVRGWLDRPTD